MYGTTIQENLCPRCGIHRTVRHGFSNKLSCFNCRLQWRPGAVLTTERNGIYPSTPTELKRLTVYRGAIAAGVYQEWAAVRRESANPRLAGGSST